jgi:hypothetical protein
MHDAPELGILVVFPVFIDFFTAIAIQAAEQITEAPFVIRA